MATTTLYPAYNVTLQFVGNPAGENAANLADISTDGTLVQSAVAAVDTYGLTRPGNDIWAISAVDAVLRARVASGAGSARVSYTLDSTTVTSATQALSTSLADYTFSALARPGGGTWATQDLARLLTGPEAIAGMSGIVEVTALRFNVTHTVRSVHTNNAVTDVGETLETPLDPVRFQTRVTIHQDDFDYAQALSTNVITLGSLVVPGTTQAVMLTMSRASVINPPRY